VRNAIALLVHAELAAERERTTELGSQLRSEQERARDAQAVHERHVGQLREEQRLAHALQAKELGRAAKEAAAALRSDLEVRRQR
jgi:hypothetical protein